jgi:hypothetical protein
MPRVNLGGPYTPPDPPEFNWESLESASELTFTEQQRMDFVAAMYRYLRYLKVQDMAAEIKDVRYHCKKILKHASALVDLLSERTKNAPSHDDNPPSADDQLSFHHNVFSQFPSGFERKSYLRVMIQLRLVAISALQKLSKEGKPGRQDKEGLDVTIRACHSVYREAGGSGFGCIRSGSSGTAKGPFLVLMEEAKKQLNGSPAGNLVIDDFPRTRNALAQRILVALKQSMPPPDRDKK